MSNEMIERVARALIKHYEAVCAEYGAFHFVGQAPTMAMISVEAMQLTPAELRAAAIARALREDAALAEQSR